VPSCQHVTMADRLTLDGALAGVALNDIPEAARRFEDMGFDGVSSFEASSDPFMPLLAAGQATTRLELSTAIAVAFARNPMICAQSAWDLHRATGGRFTLGLGTQIKPHITKRYSEQWSKPAARMQEYVAALRAIWHTFETGDRLDFRGDFYTHTLMTPMFNPGSSGIGAPKVYVAGVGPKMMRTIGESADGFFVHPFHSVEHLQTDTLQVLGDAAEAAGRERDAVDVAVINIVAMGTTDEELADGRSKAAAQLAFYGSTPAYAGVLDHHGYDGLQPRLNAMSKQGQWREMRDLIDDDLIDLLTVSGTPAECGAELARRNHFAQRCLPMFYGGTQTPEAMAALAASFAV
jgi:probable F420-dependent oxidoreductase